MAARFLQLECFGLDFTSYHKIVLMIKCSQHIGILLVLHVLEWLNNFVYTFCSSWHFYASNVFNVALFMASQLWEDCFYCPIQSICMENF